MSIVGTFGTMSSNPVFRALIIGAFVIFCFPSVSFAQDSLQISGFGWLRASAGDQTGVLEHEDVSIQLQTGIDWYFSPATRAHAHLLARDDRDGSTNETIGIVEGFLETYLTPGDARLRLRAGAFFLPTSREHVDALWETPYSVTPSALNGWLGEELRPIGIDADYTRDRLQLGATLFTANDAFGTLPAVRGWALRNHVALLDETIIAADDEHTRISVDTDDRPGWSARARWNWQSALVQYTFIDNRAEGEERDHVYPWRTPFHIISAEYWNDDWTFAAETGWGPSWIPGLKRETLTDLRASYVMVSRRLSDGRVTIRAEEMTVENDTEIAFTAAWLWNPVTQVRAAAELTTVEGDLRAMVELRGYFSLR